MLTLPTNGCALKNTEKSGWRWSSWNISGGKGERFLLLHTEDYSEACAPWGWKKQQEPVCLWTVVMVWRQASVDPLCSLIFKGTSSMCLDWWMNVLGATVVSVCACSSDHQKAGNLLRACTPRGQAVGNPSCFSLLESGVFLFLSSRFHQCKASRCG